MSLSTQAVCSFDSLFQLLLIGPAKQKWMYPSTTPLFLITPTGPAKLNEYMSFDHTSFVLDSSMGEALKASIHTTFFSFILAWIEVWVEAMLILFYGMYRLVLNMYLDKKRNPGSKYVSFDSHPFCFFSFGPATSVDQILHRSIHTTFFLSFGPVNQCVSKHTPFDSYTFLFPFVWDWIAVLVEAMLILFYGLYRLVLNMYLDKKRKQTKG